MRKFLVTAIVLVVAAGWVAVRPAGPPPLATVHFFDVGQGDAAMVSERNGHQILIDGGPDGKVLAGIGQAMPLGDRTIEAVVLSHPHADHYRGLKEVFDRYRVGVFYYSGAAQPDAEYRDLLDDARRHGAVMVDAAASGPIPMPDGDIRIIYPPKPFAGKQISNLNDASVMLLATVGTTRILFPGDGEKGEEADLLRSHPGLRADILKAPHHGSRTSSTAPFLDAIRPKAAVISVGAHNRYGHPAPSTLAAYRNRGIRTFRTDQNGTVTLTVYASGWTIRPER